MYVDSEYTSLRFDRTLRMQSLMCNQNIFLRHNHLKLIKYKPLLHFSECIFVTLQGIVYTKQLW